MKIRAIILSALILCGISAVIMYSRAAQPQQTSSVITQAINDKNTPMVIKNLILKMKEQMEVPGTDQGGGELHQQLRRLGFRGGITFHAGGDVSELLPTEPVDHQPTYPIKRLYPGGYPGMDFQLIHG